MRYHLRTLLMLMAIGPPMLAGAWIYWDITWRTLILLAIPVVFAGAIVALGMTISMPFIVAFELASALRRLMHKKRRPKN